jgi:hypothetical protein
MSNRRKGFLALGVAAVLHVIANGFVPRIGAVPAAQRNAAQDAVYFLFETLGVDELILALVLAGGLYIIGSDLLKTTFGDRVTEAFAGLGETVDNGFKGIAQTVGTGVVDLKKDFVVAWIKQLRGDSEELKEIARVAYLQAYGRTDESARDYGHNLERILLDRALGPGMTYRENAVTQVNIQKVGAAGDLISWEENTRYRLISNVANGPFPYPLRTVSRFRISADLALAMLRRCEYRIDVDNQRIAEFTSVPDDLTLDQLRRPEGFVSGDGATTVRYNGTQLVIEIRRDVMISSDTPVTIKTYEKAFVSADDDSYVLTFRQPVRNFDFYLKIDPEQFALQSAVCGPRFYWMGDDTRLYAEQEGWPDKSHFYHLHVEKWVLPGLILTARWTPVEGGTGVR